MSARPVASVGAALVAAFLAVPAGASSTVFVGARIHPVSGAPIERGAMLVEDGRIAALGADLEIPPGAEVIDLAGAEVYPGFIHPFSVLGLTEISSVRGTVDTTEIGDVNAALRAEASFNGDSLLLAPALSGGLLTAHVAPLGGLLRGTSALMALDGWNWQDMTLAAPLGMHLAYPRLRARESSLRPETQEEVDEEKKRLVRLLDETFGNARAYAVARRATARGAPAVEVNRELEALLPVLAGELPLFLHADERSQIEEALDWAAKNELDNLVLVAGTDARHLAERLARDSIPVILNGVLSLPPRDWEPYDAAYTAAAELHEAGVAFCIGDGGGGFAAANARNLPFEAAMAAAFGLPRDVALRSVTLSVAEILGVADRLGSLEPGKDATFIVTDGDPLEIRTRIVRAFLGGRELDLEADRQKRLYRKYRERPRPAPAGE